MLKSNFHTHTIFCDGSDSPEEIILHAVSLSMPQLGFSGHMDPDIHMDYPAYFQEISRLREKYKGQIDILLGAEIDNLYSPDCAPGAEYIIGSTHFLDIPSDIPMSIDNSEEMMKKLCTDYFDGDYYSLSSAYYELESKVYDRLHCTFIGHFDLVTRFNDSMHFLDETDPRYTKSALESMEYLITKDIPFEINCGAVNRGRKKELYPNHYLLKALHDLGGEIIINSDAHQKELLLGGFEAAIREAIACGFTHTNILCHNEYGKVTWKQLPLDTLLP